MNALLQKQKEAHCRVDDLEREGQVVAEGHGELIRQLEAAIKQMSLLIDGLKRNRESQAERHKVSMRDARGGAQELDRKVEEVRKRIAELQSELRRARLDALRKYLVQCEDVFLNLPDDVAPEAPVSVEMPYAVDSAKGRRIIFMPIGKGIWDDVAKGDLGPMSGNAASLIWSLFVATGMDNRNSNLIPRKDFVEVRTSVVFEDSPTEQKARQGAPKDATLILLRRLPEEVEVVVLRDDD